MRRVRWEKIKQMALLHSTVKKISDITSESIRQAYTEKGSTTIKGIIEVCLDVPAVGLRELFRDLQREDIEYRTQFAGELANIVCNHTIRTLPGFRWGKFSAGSMKSYSHMIIEKGLYRYGENGKEHICDLRMIPVGAGMLPDINSDPEIVEETQYFIEKRNPLFKSLLSTIQSVPVQSRGHIPIAV